MLHSSVAIAVNSLLHGRFQWVEQQEVCDVPERDTVFDEMLIRDRGFDIEALFQDLASRTPCGRSSLLTIAVDEL